MRGGGERDAFMKPVPAGLDESSLDEATRRIYENTPMAPTTKLLSLLREEAGSARIDVNALEAA
eukprot:CAMPEP_0180329066 /NCGR_PEP_ID=MMETSP0988-20121125/40564_1 /TAXON_ID=697907 /ORGANISM="non described non described, Strain CCMP2293" /LENGTH=63 /DNA_ID=CAMNT_0022316147 /DNA_START=141 /DNA_END=328 /DNA_ORIENTATION=+